MRFLSSENSHCSRELVAVNEGPDVIYVMDFLYTEISVGMMMCLIFLPKVQIGGVGSMGEYLLKVPCLSGENITLSLSSAQCVVCA